MNIFICLILYLTIIQLVQSQRSPIDYYSRFEVEQLGFVYGRGSGYFQDSTWFKFWIYEFFAPDPTDFSFEVKLAGTANGPVEYKESCIRTPPSRTVECFMELTGKNGINSGTMTIHVTGKNGISFTLFRQTYTNSNLGSPYGCENEPSSQCVCMSGSKVKTPLCDSVVTQACSVLKPTKDPVELNEFSKLAMKIQFKKAFSDTNIEETSLFVYDDSTHKYYALSYAPVPQEIDAQPIATDQFRMTIRIGEVSKTLNPPKQNYIITNFEIEKIVDFGNAFCRQVDDRNLICVCCEYSEKDDFCKFFLGFSVLGISFL